MFEFFADDATEYLGVIIDPFELQLALEGVDDQGIVLSHFITPHPLTVKGSASLPAHFLRGGCARAFFKLIAVPHDTVDCPLGVGTHDVLAREDFLVAEAHFAGSEYWAVCLQIVFQLDDYFMGGMGVLAALLVVTGANVSVFSVHFVQIFAGEVGVPIGLFLILLMQELIGIKRGGCLERRLIKFATSFSVPQKIRVIPV